MGSNIIHTIEFILISLIVLKEINSLMNFLQSSQRFNVSQIIQKLGHIIALIKQKDYERILKINAKPVKPL
jgi:hypothetical protein